MLTILISVMLFTQTNTIVFVLQDKWFGLLHCVCNKHTWTGGKCGHEELAGERNFEWFDRREGVFKTLQDIITNPKLLKTFKFYTHFR